MTVCKKCGARNQFLRDLSGDVTCLACGASPGAVARPVRPRAKECSRGHPLPYGPPCYPCIDHVGRSAPIANASQRAGMRGAIKR